MHASKKWYLFFVGITIVLFCVYLLCHHANRYPCISFVNGTYHDFGTIDEGQTIKYEFSLKNIGRSDLIVKDIKSSCGCTGAKISKKIVAPSEIAKVVVTYKGRSTPNRETVPIWIISNDPEKSVSQLTLAGTVRMKVFWYPKSLSFFSETPHTTQIKDIQLITENLENLSIRKIQSSCEYIRTKYEKNTKGFNCEITLIPGKIKGNITESIIIECLVNNEVIKVNIPIYLMIH